MMQRWIFKQNTVCLIFHVECVWWLLIIIASTLTIHLTVQHLENNKILVLVSDVAATCMFKSSMSSPGDIFVWVSLWLSANIPSYCLLHFLPRNGIVCDNIWGGGEGVKGACSDLSVYNTMYVTTQLAYLPVHVTKLSFKRNSKFFSIDQIFGIIPNTVHIMLGSYFIGLGVWSK